MPELKQLDDPLTIEQQIENLKKLHLEFEDEEEAKEKLNTISYYRLVKAYSSSLKNRETGVYKKKVSFEHICRLYEFDDDLRRLLLPLLERIEITLRCRLTNYFSTEYGNLGYLEAKNFSGEYNELRRRMVSSIEMAAESSPSIKHYKENYV